jgi:hypothetical protein
MKNMLRTFLLICATHIVHAQIPTSNFTVDGQTFAVEIVALEANDPNPSLFVENTQSLIKSGAVVSNGIPSNDCYRALTGFANYPFYTFEYNKPDFIRLYDIFREVFPMAKATALGALKEEIDLRFLITPQGQVLEVWYQFSKDLNITPAELALLDRRLKESMHFTFKPNHVCSSSTVIGLQGWGVRFKDLYTPYGYGYGADWEESDRILQMMIQEGEDPRN